MTLKRNNVRIQIASHHQSIRLSGFDYSQPAAYFVTLVTWHRECIFGKVVEGKMQLNVIGEVIRSEWQRLPQHFRNLSLVASVVMPNHFHGIIVIEESLAQATRPQVIDATREDKDLLDKLNNGHDGSPLQMAHLNGPASYSLGAMIGQFKSRATKQIWKIQMYNRLPIWQRGYYEHVIRNEKEMEKIFLYIEGNPVNWDEDKHFTHH